MAWDETPENASGVVWRFRNNYESQEASSFMGMAVSKSYQ